MIRVVAKTKPIWGRRSVACRSFTRQRVVRARRAAALRAEATYEEKPRAVTASVQNKANLRRDKSSLSIRPFNG